MDFKQLSQEIKDIDSAQGIIKAYANAYNNIDSDEDMSMPGSFNKTVRDNYKRIRVLKDHYSTQSLGVPKEIDPNDSYGLLTVSQFNMKKDLAKDMFYDVQLAIENGQNAELSIGYEVINSRPMKINGQDIRQITEYKLYEYSFLSSWAANPMAIALDAKSFNPQMLIEKLSKAYNLPYSDTRLSQIETLLKSLDKEPINIITPDLEPIQHTLSLNSFSLLKK